MYELNLVKISKQPARLTW